MAPVKEKETKGVAGVPWRFEPLSKDRAGPDQTEIGEGRKTSSREKTRDGIASAAVSRNGARTPRLSLRGRRPRRSLPGRRLWAGLAVGLAVGQEKTGTGIAALASVSRKGAWAPLGSMRGRLLWAAVAALVAVAVFVAGGSSGSGDDPSPQPPELVSAPAPAPVAVKPENKPQKAQRAKKADEKGTPVTDSEGSSAPAPTSSDSPSRFDGQSVPPSSSAPTPPPAPSGGQSDDPDPGILHGIEVGGP